MCLKENERQNYTNTERIYNSLSTQQLITLIKQVETYELGFELKIFNRLALSSNEYNEYERLCFILNIKCYYKNECKI